MARREEWMARRAKRILTDCDIFGDRLGLVLGCDNCQPQHKNLAAQHDHDKQREFWDKAAECGMCGPRIWSRIAANVEWQ